MDLTRALNRLSSALERHLSSTSSAVDTSAPPVDTWERLERSQPIPTNFGACSFPGVCCEAPPPPAALCLRLVVRGFAQTLFCLIVVCGEPSRLAIVLGRLKSLEILCLLPPPLDLLPTSSWSIEFLTVTLDFLRHLFVWSRWRRFGLCWRRLDLRRVRRWFTIPSNPLLRCRFSVCLARSLCLSYGAGQGINKVVSGGRSIALGSHVAS